MTPSKEAINAGILVYYGDSTPREDEREYFVRVLNAAYAIDFAALQAHAQALAEVLAGLVKCNEEWNASVETTIGRPVGWVDAYLMPARAVLAAARRDGVVK